ncbi:hypothetical protein [Microbulbifer sediminum]|uniref:hypothetical protein n=1 Tax=Microbulbifer sediminum TaxID=2904250 RepID=UPI001F2C42F2|nr:hypothetical protein [Microbulbifer sediminum]
MQHHSFGLAALTGEIVQPGCHILDLGPLSSGTTDAFLKLNCPCYIEDLIEFFTEHGNDQDRKDALADHLVPKPSRVKFDVVLCWDLLNFLPPELLRHLLELLEPNLKPGTIFHTMMYTGTRLPEKPASFRHVGDFTFETGFDGGMPELSPYRYSTLSLMQAMGRFTLRNSTLQREGMRKDVIEHMLEYGNSRPQARIQSGGASDVSSYFSQRPAEALRLPGLSEVLERARKSPLSTVLDCGPRSGRNIDGLQKQVGELFVQDLFTQIRWQRERGRSFQDAAEAALQQVLPEQGLDAILLWDLINFFTADEVAFLSRLLVSGLRPRGLLHLVVLKQAALPSRPGIFEIQADGSSKIHIPASGESPRNFNSITEIMQALPYLSLVAQGHGKLPGGALYHELTLQNTAGNDHV